MFAPFGIRLFPTLHIPTFTHPYIPYTNSRAKSHGPKGGHGPRHLGFLYRRPILDLRTS